MQSLKGMILEIDLTGRKFGRLTVIERAEDYITPSDGRHRARWKCICECGNYTFSRQTSLLHGDALSCGCLRDERFLNGVSKHNGVGTRLYNIWNSMRQRCNNPKNRAYHNYGGRGIKICKEWDNFATFRDWAISTGYDEKAAYGQFTLDRVDVDGSYSPDNCKWITMREQGLNKRNTVKLTYNGVTMPLKMWAKTLNLNYSTLWKRYSLGKTPEQILNL